MAVLAALLFSSLFCSSPLCAGPSSALLFSSLLTLLALLSSTLFSVSTARRSACNRLHTARCYSILSELWCHCSRTPEHDRWERSRSVSFESLATRHLLVEVHGSVNRAQRRCGWCSWWCDKLAALSTPAVAKFVSHTSIACCSLSILLLHSASH